MGKHDKHLPKKDLNKGVSFKTKADSKTLQRVSRAQGQTTKQDAKTPQPPRGR